jgi:hypothetical protein
MKEINKEIIKKSSVDKLNVNLWLLGILFTVFTFLIATNAQILKENNIIAFQLTLAIPLLMSSIFARQKLIYAEKREREWYNYGFVTFIVSYAFLINSIGIMMAFLINTKVSMLFFLANIISPLTYSYMEIKDDKEKIKTRILKDSIFILIIVLLGIIPSLFL